MESFAFAYGITTQPRVFHGFLRETIGVYSETSIYQCRMTALISVPNTRTAFLSISRKPSVTRLSAVPYTMQIWNRQCHISERLYKDLVDLLDDVVVVDVLDHDNTSVNSTRAAVTAIDAMKPKPSAAPVLVAVADNAPNTMMTISRAMIRAIMARLAYSRRR